MDGIKPYSGTDKLIGAYIENCRNPNFNDVLREDERLEAATYLSDLANGMFGWYPFDAKGKVLQVGSWFGAFTELLCEKCSHVTVLEKDGYRAEMTRRRLDNVSNLNIIAGNLEEFCHGSGTFDYIIFAVDERIDRFENAGEYKEIFQIIKNVMHIDSKILFASPNRFGVKYFSGEPDPATGRAFDGMSEDSSLLYRFDKAELMAFMAEQGFQCVKMYYPMPDHRCTQLIYTDEYHPGTDVRERLHIYVDHKTRRLLDEPLLVDRLTKNDVMPFFSNSFLIEAGNSPCCNVIYAALSTERSRENAFATNICDDDTVRKIPLYPEGKAGIQRILDNTKALAQHGVPVLHMDNAPDGGLVMKRIHSPSLASHLRECIKYGKEGLLEVVDKLHDYILASSASVSEEKNCMRDHAPDAEWGVILEKAYIEMIPVNCFYREGEFLFYDQEYARENCPADYVLYRALRDLYAFIPEAESVLPLEEIKEKYGLTFAWPYYEKEEIAFQDELRQRMMYSGFFHWVRYLCAVMKDNRRTLMMCDGEMKFDYFDPVEGCDERRIVLFGTGQYADYYMEKYGTIGDEIFKPVFMVDNNRERWGTEKNGISVKAPDEIMKLMPGTYRVVVAVADYQPVVRQLEGMGIGEDSYRIISRRLDLLRGGLTESNAMSDGKYNIGYVTGVFDLFHIGHLNILKNCKSRCHYLVAGVLTDELTERDKHKTPFIPFEERLEIVKQCKYVDRVIPVDFTNTNKVDAWKEIRYGCLFSGSDHEGEGYWTWLQRELRHIGSDLEFFPYTQSTSSSMLQAVIRGHTKESK